MTTRSPSLRRRPSRAVPATIVSILLIALGFALAWTGIAKLVDGRWPAAISGLRDFLTALTWNSSGGWIIAGCAVVVGIVLLLAAIIPGRRSAVYITPGRPADDGGPANGGSAAGPADASSAGGPPMNARAEEFVLTRKAIARLATSEADRVDGVSSVSAVATAKRVTLRVTTPLRQTAELRSQVTQQVSRRLAEVNLSPVPKVLMTVTTKEQ